MNYFGVAGIRSRDLNHDDIPPDDADWGASVISL